MQSLVKIHLLEGSRYTCLNELNTYCPSLPLFSTRAFSGFGTFKFTFTFRRPAAQKTPNFGPFSGFRFAVEIALALEPPTVS